MNLYRVYGSTLAAKGEFPELRPAPSDAVPRWTFRTVSRLAAPPDAVEVGYERIYGNVYARLYRHAEGHRIVVDDTGTFDLSPDASQIRFLEKSGAWPDFVRAHLLGRVLATALYLDGLLPLHGSAVAFGDRVVAFLAPKGFGKSSIALALTGHGAKLVTDDTLPVDPGDPPSALPGVHAVRAHADALAAIGRTDSGPRTREGKTLIASVPDHEITNVPGRLEAVYLLHPVIADSGAAELSRTGVPSVPATVAVVGYVKIAGMLGGAAAQVLLDRAAAVVRAVPVYTLAVPRDLSVLPRAAAGIAAWHREPSRAAGT